MGNLKPEDVKALARCRRQQEGGDIGPETRCLAASLKKALSTATQWRWGTGLCTFLSVSDTKPAPGMWSIRGQETALHIWQHSAFFFFFFFAFLQQGVFPGLMLKRLL